LFIGATDALNKSTIIMRFGPYRIGKETHPADTKTEDCNPPDRPQRGRGTGRDVGTHNQDRVELNPAHGTDHKPNPVLGFVVLAARSLGIELRLLSRQPRSLLADDRRELRFDLLVIRQLSRNPLKLRLFSTTSCGGLWALGLAVLLGGLRLFGVGEPTSMVLILLSISGLATLPGSAAS
jgi:hypothetical protein